jgi:hypothetical protein
MAYRVDIILSDGTDEGTARPVGQMTDTTAFRVFIEIVEDGSPIPVMIKLDNVILWLWNAISNNLWNLYIVALGTLLRSGPHIGLPGLQNYPREGPNLLWTEWYHKMT